VLVDHGDAVLNMVLHRGHSHSLLWTSIAGALLGACAARVHGQWAIWRRWSLAIWLAMATHPLLDAITVYGTQLLQPFTDEAYGVGSIFIIDPLYTLPLLASVMLALRRPVAYGLKWNLRLLAFSSIYLAWSMVAQAWAQSQVQRVLSTQGIQAQALLVTPAPLNTLLWRAVVVQGDHYLEGYYSLFDAGRPVRWTVHPRGSDLMQIQAHHPHVQRMLRFTDGMVRLRIENGNLWLTDLRMGQQGAYVFDFDLGPPLAPGQTPPAAVQHSQRPPVQESLQWLWARMWSADLPPMSATP
jgi:inner membrane protein